MHANRRRCALCAPTNAGTREKTDRVGLVSLNYICREVLLVRNGQLFPIKRIEETTTRVFTIFSFGRSVPVGPKKTDIFAAL